MKRIKITIHKDGTQTVEVLGAQGKECLKFTERLEHRLGEPVGERQLKAEYETEHVQETEEQREYEA